MKKVNLLMLSFIFLAACGKDDHDTTNIQTESNAVSNLISVSYRGALAASNADSVAAVFTTDGVVMGTGLPTASGSAQIKSAYESTFGAVAININFKIDEIIVGKNYAFARSTSAGITTVKATGTGQPEENRELFVAQKINGHWKLSRYIYNKMGVLNQATAPAIQENKSFNYSEDDKTAIKTLITGSYAKAINASDAAAAADNYTPDAVLMAPDTPTMKGAASIKSTYQAVFADITLNLAFTIDDVVVDGEYGYVRSHSTGTTLIKASGQTIPSDYREIFVVKKVNDKWKIAWYNYNQPK